MTPPTFFTTSGAFRRWLKANAGTATELIVGFHKVGTGQPCMTWSESVDQALCFGWIDGVRKRIDDATYSIRFTPRKPTSIWSAINIAKFEKLRENGSMTRAGELAFAKRTALRSAIYSHEQAGTAELLSAEIQAFRSHPVAWAYFEACPPGYKKIVLHWVTTAKRAPTRSPRLAKLMDACATRQRLR